MKFRSLWLLLFALIPAMVSGVFVEKKDLERLFVEGVSVDLRNPVFKDGVLFTDQGGIVTAEGLRIQAQTIRYIRRSNEARVEAEGSVMVDYKGRIVIGDSLTYDFQEKTGVVKNGRAGLNQWFAGGDEVSLNEDGTITLVNAFVTTCDNQATEWQIRGSNVKITTDNQVSARNITFRYVRIPVFWVPLFKANLQTFTDSPIEYRIGFGGSQGVALRARYRFWSWREWSAFARLDWVLKRGLGGGLETHYKPEDQRSELFTRSYLAKDLNVLIPKKETRYRLEGMGKTTLDDDKYQVNIQWDRVSDEDMASDYHDRLFNYQHARTTELTVRRQDEDWIGNLTARVRLNGFQTVKEELPVFESSLRPISLGSTGIISENKGSVGHVGLEFAKDITTLTDFSSARAEINSRVYRPFSCKYATVTPHLQGVGIFYSTSPTKQEQWQGVLITGVDSKMSLSREWSNKREILVPYCNFTHMTVPTVNPTRHYIFDLNDGYWNSNVLTFGIEQTILKRRGGELQRYLVSNVWAHLFLSGNTTAKTVPRVYGTMLWNMSQDISHSLDSAWDLDRNNFDHFNWRTEWTLSEDLAVAGEFRHRSAYSWRKVDHQNFVIDFFRSEGSLRLSPLSDRRDTLLGHLFYRVNPQWFVRGESRIGLNRPGQEDYFEFGIHVSTVLHCAWLLTVSYDHREHDERFGVDVKLLGDRPKPEDRHSIGWLR